MGNLHSALWYNYIFSLDSTPSYTLLSAQYSHAKIIVNSWKGHNIVRSNCNSYYQNKESEVGITNTLYRRLCVHRGRSGRARKIAPPMVCDPRTIQPLESRHTG